MLKVGEYTFSWVHEDGITTCSVHKGKSEVPSADFTTSHNGHNHAKKDRVFKSFRGVVAKCPSRQLRTVFWEGFNEWRNPTVVIDENTRLLVAYLDYFKYKMHKRILEKAAEGVTNWPEVPKPHIATKIKTKSEKFREGDNDALISLSIWALIGYVNELNKNR